MLCTETVYKIILEISKKVHLIFLGLDFISIINYLLKHFRKLYFSIVAASLTGWTDENDQTTYVTKTNILLHEVMYTSCKVD